MKSFFSMLQLKIIGGYILLLVLLCAVVFLVRLEHGKMEELDSREHSTNMRRKAVSRTFEKLLGMMGMLKKCSKEIFAIQNLPVPVANEVYMTDEQVCAMLHISSRTLQKLCDEKGIAYTAIGGKFLYPLSKLQLLLEENYRSYVR